MTKTSIALMRVFSGAYTACAFFALSFSILGIVDEKFFPWFSGLLGGSIFALLSVVTAGVADKAEKELSSNG